MTEALEYQRKLERFRQLKKQEEHKSSLPHLYLFKWYLWAWKFFTSRNKINLLVAANQISKTSTQIRKAIHWSTSPELWPGLWPKCQNLNPGFKPIFWYLYPDRDTATEQWEVKWLGEFLPRGAMIDDPQYGWREERDKDGKIYAVYFNSGATLFFKTYTKQTKNMQGATVHAVFTDEELPIEHYQELLARITATDGYFHMVFTATLGQDFWRCAMEEVGSKKETLVTAFKQCVSLYDCLKYKDGSASPWTKERILEIVGNCRSKNEELKRVHGRFVKDAGLKYPTFNRDKHYVKPYKIAKDWDIYSGTDIGSGGSAHPGAIAWVAVNPARTKVVVFDGWKGDETYRTTAGWIFEKWRDMKNAMSKPPVIASYDWACADYHTIATAAGESVIPAEKSHQNGERILNTMFEMNILEIMNVPQLSHLPVEFSTLDDETPKTKAKDDGIDSVRYAIMAIPVNWSAIFKKIIDEKKEKKEPRDERREGFTHTPDKKDEYSNEFDEINEQAGVDGAYW